MPPLFDDQIAPANVRAKLMPASSPAEQHQESSPAAAAIVGLLEAEIGRLRSDGAEAASTIRRANFENERLAKRLRTADERVEALEEAVTGMSRNDSRHDDRHHRNSLRLLREVRALSGSLQNALASRLARHHHHHQNEKRCRAAQAERRTVTFDRALERREEYYFDRNDAPKMYYSRPEMKKFNQSRFDDASRLRHRRKGSGAGSARVDPDAGENRDTDGDADDLLSSRGIEHFVRPDLQREMIARKQRVQSEVIEFGRSGAPDPQGWRIAKASRANSRWAREAARERGLRYEEYELRQRGDADVRGTRSSSGTEASAEADGREVAGAVSRKSKEGATEGLHSRELPVCSLFYGQ